ncbi:AN1-type zinc finger protein 1 [Dispira parvispora]|uniref:AN1-type zinc finger protein 1 n=1 Tax=Dispira parvispora TaxID=1520584 RepID=A0A9W8AXB8_9FUNG|nr:AN1-type zinc finger protein 1 [Dispira parvispora]
MSDCGQQAVVMSLCPHCHQVHCLDHRHPDQHRCSHRDAAPSASSKKPIVDRAWIRDTLGLPASKPTTGYKAPPPARPIIATKECGGPRSRVALMQLKGRAKGDAKIPLGERVYCTVIIRPSQGAAVECPLFFAKRHTIGKVLDVAMSHTAITGVDKQRLRPQDPESSQRHHPYQRQDQPSTSQRVPQSSGQGPAEASLTTTQQDYHPSENRVEAMPSTDQPARVPLSLVLKFRFHNMLIQGSPDLAPLKSDPHILLISGEPLPVWSTNKFEVYRLLGWVETEGLFVLSYAQVPCFHLQSDQCMFRLQHEFHLPDGTLVATIIRLVAMPPFVARDDEQGKMEWLKNMAKQDAKHAMAQLDVEVTDRIGSQTGVQTSASELAGTLAGNPSVTEPFGLKTKLEKYFSLPQVPLISMTTPRHLEPMDQDLREAFLTHRLVFRLAMESVCRFVKQVPFHGVPGKSPGIRHEYSQLVSMINKSIGVNNMKAGFWSILWNAVASRDAILELAESGEKIIIAYVSPRQVGPVAEIIDFGSINEANCRNTMNDVIPAFPVFTYKRISSDLSEEGQLRKLMAHYHNNDESFQLFRTGFIPLLDTLGIPY